MYSHNPQIPDDHRPLSEWTLGQLRLLCRQEQLDFTILTETGRGDGSFSASVGFPELDAEVELSLEAPLDLPEFWYRAIRQVMTDGLNANEKMQTVRDDGYESRQNHLPPRIYPKPNPDPEPEPETREDGETK